MKNTLLQPKRWLLIPGLVWLLTGCVSNGISWTTNANIKKIALGMSKEQVVAILGQNYLIASASKDDYGRPIEMLVYKSDQYEEYRLRFVNAQLTDWNREYTNKYIVKDTSP